MADDRSKRRAGSVHGVTFKRQQTSPGTPVSIQPAEVPDEIDDGPTPLPVNAEEAHSWQHVGSRVTRVELTQQSTREWLGRIEALVDEFAIPSLKKLMGQIDDLLRRQERNSERLEVFFDDQWPKLCEAVDELGTRLERVERKQDDFVREIALHNDRITRAEKTLDEIERRVDRLERKNDDAALAKTAATAERKRLITWARAAYAVATALVGVGAYLAGIHL